MHFSGPCAHSALPSRKSGVHKYTGGFLSPQHKCLTLELHGSTADCHTSVKIEKPTVLSRILSKVSHSWVSNVRPWAGLLIVVNSSGQELSKADVTSHCAYRETGLGRSNNLPKVTWLGSRQDSNSDTPGFSSLNPDYTESQSFMLPCRSPPRTPDKKLQTWGQIPQF